ncbi:hypothetical protein BZA05DRAFT_25373 [Tricharina praecox]|uniref:uncharacterized protein n=1 Tax=Tricharina praecox TaxID=43433 RepID=UPI00221FE103|nr:uncharacterized protein BZA05DRAFT_25373 [Tricharina praecox]KAI5853319.1 hypothetical protein BZA05DRAFT_25373 [Tricharina praecox]
MMGTYRSWRGWYVCALPTYPKTASAGGLDKPACSRWRLSWFFALHIGLVEQDAPSCHRSRTHRRELSTAARWKSCRRIGTAVTDCCRGPGTNYRHSPVGRIRNYRQPGTAATVRRGGSGTTVNQEQPPQSVAEDQELPSTRNSRHSPSRRIRNYRQPGTAATVRRGGSGTTVNQEQPPQSVAEDQELPSQCSASHITIRHKSRRMQTAVPTFHRPRRIDY